MNASLTLIVEGKPLVFDVPVPVGEVIPAGTWFVFRDASDGEMDLNFRAHRTRAFPNYEYFTARPPVAPESFADGDVAWVRVTFDGEHRWMTPDAQVACGWSAMREWIKDGTAYLLPSPRPESLADVLDDLGLTDEQRARVEKAVGK